MIKANEITESQLEGCKLLAEMEGIFHYKKGREVYANANQDIIISRYLSDWNDLHRVVSVIRGKIATMYGSENNVNAELILADISYELANSSK